MHKLMFHNDVQHSCFKKIAKDFGVDCLLKAFIDISGIFSNKCQFFTNVRIPYKFVDIMATNNALQLVE